MTPYARARRSAPRSAVRRTEAPHAALRRWLPGFAAALVLAAVGACDHSTTEPGALAGIVIAPDTGVKLFVEQSTPLRAVAVDAHSVQIANLADDIQWSSDNGDVATVNGQGVVTAVAAGTATITAAIDNVTESVPVKVVGVKSVRVVFPDGEGRVTIGGGVQACAQVIDTDDNVMGDQVAAWSVEDGAIASVSPESGECTTVTGVERGEVNVKAEYKGREGTAKVRVVRGDGSVEDVQITNVPSEFVAGDCVTLTVIAHDEDDNPVDQPVTFRSSDSDKATVSSAGRACWEKAGDFTITAEVDGVTDSFTARVDPVPLTVVGVADRPPGGLRRAFKWTEAGGMKELDAPPNISITSSWAKGVNDNGQIVGEYTTSNGKHAFIYTEGRKMRELPKPDGADSAEATDVNNAGYVGGSAFFPNNQQHLVVWTVAGDEIDVFDRGMPQGGTRANTEEISENGVIAGTGNDETEHARAYRAGVAGGITLLTRADDEIASLATGINRHAYVVGYYVDGEGKSRPFIARGDNKIRALNLPPGCPQAVAYGIDRDDRVVVTGLNCSGKRDRTFVGSSTGGSYIEVASQGHTQARAMNDVGDVVGWTLNEDKKNEAYLWRRSTQRLTMLGFLANGPQSQAFGLSNGTQ